MNDREQIQKMANIIADCSFGDPGSKAIDLYNAKCRILTEDSVVLTKKEYEVLKIKETEKHWLQTCMSIWENAKIDARKETAEKFVNMFKQEILNRYGDLAYFDLYFSVADKVAKQFGAEIE